jgi:hypothetical protein
VRIQFRYRRGTIVYYAGDWTHRYLVSQQRYTRRDILSPLYEYLVSTPDSPDSFWAYEADLATEDELRWWALNASA